MIVHERERERDRERERERERDRERETERERQRETKKEREKEHSKNVGGRSILSVSWQHVNSQTAPPVACQKSIFQLKACWLLFQQIHILG